MYVVCVGSSAIRLYDTDTYNPLDQVINVDRVIYPLDIAVCRDDRQLYVAERWRIWRVTVDSQSYEKWLTSDPTKDEFEFNCLSMTSRHLLVTSELPPSLRQYHVTDAQLLRVVYMPRYVKYLWHGVETTRGTFVVCHSGTSQREWQYAVSEVDVCGEVIRTFTDVYGPHYLYADNNGDMLVADYDNHRVILLDSQLQLHRVLIDSDSPVKVRAPKCLILQRTDITTLRCTPA